MYTQFLPTLLLLNVMALLLHKLFTKYERIVGDEYWSGTVKPNFQHPDIGLMADAFCYFESNVHARFYNRINELLGLATEEFHQSWQYDPVLASRVGYLDAIAGSRDIPLSLAVFSMMEGCILYSSFAFLKHFQSNGKNKLSNLVAGINFSVRDENIHHEAGAWLFRTYMEENKLDKEWMKDRVVQAAKALLTMSTVLLTCCSPKETLKVSMHLP